VNGGSGPARRSGPADIAAKTGSVDQIDWNLHLKHASHGQGLLGLASHEPEYLAEFQELADFDSLAIVSSEMRSEKL